MKKCFPIAFAICAVSWSSNILTKLPEQITGPASDEVYQFDAQKNAFKKLEKNIASMSWVNSDVMIIGASGSSDEFLNIKPRNSSVVLRVENSTEFRITSHRKLATLRKDLRLFKLTNENEKRQLQYATRSLVFLHNSCINKTKEYVHKINISKLEDTIFSIKPELQLERGSYFFLLFSRDLDYCIKHFAPKSTFKVSAFDIY